MRFPSFTFLKAVLIFIPKVVWNEHSEAGAITVLPGVWCSVAMLSSSRGKANLGGRDEELEAEGETRG